MPSTNRQPTATVSRRRALQWLGSMGAATALAPMLSACGRDEPENDAGDSPSPAGGATGLAGSVTIAIPLATGEDQGFYTAQFERFTAQTGVEVNFLHFPNPQYGESIQGLFRGGDAPDVYRMATPPALMEPSYANDWLQSLDGYQAITDLLADQYGESALNPGTSGLHIGGELYGVPGVANTAWNVLRPFMVNPELLDRYGVSEPPETWSELRDAAAKVSTDSGGDAYGYALLGGNNLLRSNNLLPLWATAGPVRDPAPAVPIDYQTGQAAASHPSVVEAVALARGLVEDGSVVPGWQNMDAPAFWQAWAAGQIAMAPISCWWAQEIAKINPQAGMAFVAGPVPDSGRQGTMSVEFEWTPTWGMTKESANPEAAAALIAFLGSLDVQRQYYDAAKVPSALASEYADDLDEIAQSILALVQEISKAGPSPTARSVDAAAVLQAIQAALPTPGFDEIIFTAVDQGADYEAAAAAFDAALNDVIAAEIGKAIDGGADLDEDIFTFGDWDPMADYVTEPGS